MKFGSTNAASYVVNSATQITAVSPAGTGSVNVSVTTVNGTGTSSGTFTFVACTDRDRSHPDVGPRDWWHQRHYYRHWVYRCDCCHVWRHSGSKLHRQLGHVRSPLCRPPALVR